MNALIPFNKNIADDLKNNLHPFILFPEGYDPMVAAGPYKDRDMEWGQDATDKMRLLEFEVEEILLECEKEHVNGFPKPKNPPVRRWIQNGTKAEFLKTLSWTIDFQI